MKWPRKVILVRHGESEFNRVKEQQRKDPEYQRFVKLFEQEFNLDKFQRHWPYVKASKELRGLAVKMYRKYFLPYSNRLTPLTDTGWLQAERLGRTLKILPDARLPDVILVSPYLRTKQTLEGMTRGWPELAGIKQETEPLIREIDIGLAGLYNNWRVMETFHPEQRYIYLRDGKYDYCYPQGENVLGVEGRMRLLSGKLIREFSEREVLLVSHHITITAFISTQERWESQDFTRKDDENPIKNCSYTIFVGDPEQGESGEGKLMLQTLNALPCS
ncbi:MAG: histidine phosphatase family protein [Candidatus Sungiibacteriota bacterium]|uniref:Histidine phosphatase family protein n=1 Tax=Candidatus Sungiibacteriota bacterium TaxID=2750080 RepID=A0A7T5RJE1_9BACT|nr:MAG: histidine phosphatase family protein [Candidatus Sungbacteria bacterium]